MPSVTLQRSGRTFDVQSNETILDAATRQGILIPYGCRNGACGSCRGRVVAGSIHYPGGDPPALDERFPPRGVKVRAFLGDDVANVADVLAVRRREPGGAGGPGGSIQRVLAEQQVGQKVVEESQFAHLRR